LTGTAVLVTMLLCFLFDAESGLFQCPFHSLTNFDCPGCGLQRSMIFLFRGEIIASIQMYWTTIPILIMFSYGFLFLKYRYRNGVRNLLYIFSFNAALIVCNYIYKITNYL
jgi:hypothetical protein